MDKAVTYSTDKHPMRTWGKWYDANRDLPSDTIEKIFNDWIDGRHDLVIQEETENE